MAKDLLLFEHHGVGPWEQFGDLELHKMAWAHPDMAARRLLYHKVGELNNGGPHKDDDFDGVLRVRLWRGKYTEADACLAPPDRWPDAMVTYHKPDTSILQAAINAAAAYYAPYMGAHHDLQAAGHYQGALRVTRAVLEAHDELTGVITKTSAADMISVAAALLPDYR